MSVWPRTELNYVYNIVGKEEDEEVRELIRVLSH
jgi:hypothetical protein